MWLGADRLVARAGGFGFPAASLRPALLQVCWAKDCSTLAWERSVVSEVALAGRLPSGAGRAQAAWTFSLIDPRFYQASTAASDFTEWRLFSVENTVTVETIC